MERIRHGRVLVCRGFASAAACERVIAGMDRGVATRSEIVADGIRVAADIRRSFDVEVEAAVLGFLDELLAPAAAIISEEFALSGLRFEGPGCLRYPPGGFYRQHRDVMPVSSANAWPRRISLVLFLNGGGVQAVEGGELRIHELPDWIELAPEEGTLVAFPADLVHAVLPVRAGIRQTVVDWLG